MQRKYKTINNINILSNLVISVTFLCLNKELENKNQKMKMMLFKMFINSISKLFFYCSSRASSVMLTFRVVKPRAIAHAKGDAATIVFIMAKRRNIMPNTINHP
jgi:hypothetical protein